jgi:acylglycerol lipase
MEHGPHRQIDGSGIPFRLGTGLNLVRALAACRNMLSELTVPFLILHGTQDYGVPLAGSELLWNTAPSRHHSRFFRLEGVYHDLLADPLAEKCMEEITKWLHEHL